MYIIEILVHFIVFFVQLLSIVNNALLYPIPYIKYVDISIKNTYKKTVKLLIPLTIKRNESHVNKRVKVIDNFGHNLNLN